MMKNEAGKKDILKTSMIEIWYKMDYIIENTNVTYEITREKSIK